MRLEETKMEKEGTFLLEEEAGLGVFWNHLRRKNKLIHFF